MPAVKCIVIPDRVAQRALSRFALGEGGCRISTYSVASHGYAQIGWQADDRGWGVTAHRAAWTAVHGQIPDGMTVHHRCHERRCVNVEHLELLSNEYNARRNRPGLDWARDGSCANGHGPEFWRPISFMDGHRRNRCSACMADWQRTYRARKAVS